MGRSRDDIADQGVVPGDHDALAHSGLCEQRRFHLAGLHPVAAHLQLRVHPTEEFQPVVGPPADQVAGAVAAGTWRAVRIGDEGPGSGTGPPSVAVRHAGCHRPAVPAAPRGRSCPRASQTVTVVRLSGRPMGGR